MNQTSIQTAQTARSSQTNSNDAATTTIQAQSTAVRFVDVLNNSVAIGGTLVSENQLKKTAETLGAQMNAELFAVNPLFAALMMEQSAQNPEALLMQAGMPQSAEALSALAALAQESNMASAQLSTAAVGNLPQVLAAEGQSIPAEFADAVNPLNPDGKPSAIQVVSAMTGTDTDQPTALHAQTAFNRAVEQAQRMLSESDRRGLNSDETELDVDELQQKVNSGEFLPRFSETGLIKDLSMVSKAEGALNPEEIFNQIKAGANTHIQNGNSNFTIKLTPEGLGEITVSLIEESGKMTLSLVASNANVQRLLNSELTNLRDIMRPYNVEVTQVAQSNEAQSMNMQQFSHGSYSGQQQQPNFVYYSGFAEDADEPAATQAVTMSSTILDAYI